MMRGLISRVLMSALVLTLGGAATETATGCSSGDCRSVTCAEIAGSLSNNGKSFTKCYRGVAPIETTIEDESGNVIYDCTDGSDSTCTEATVNAEFAYCDVQ